jgi:hypothetical protein
LFRLVKPLIYSGANAVGKEALKTGSTILTDILDKQPDQPIKTIFRSRLGEAKDNLEQKIETMTGSGLSLKRKRKSKKSQSRSKRCKVKDIFTAKRKKIQ